MLSETRCLGWFLREALATDRGRLSMLIAVRLSAAVVSAMTAVP